MSNNLQPLPHLFYFSTLFGDFYNSHDGAAQRSIT